MKRGWLAIALVLIFALSFTTATYGGEESDAVHSDTLLTPGPESVVPNENPVSDELSNSLSADQNSTRKAKRITLTGPRGSTKRYCLNYGETISLKVKISPYNTYNKDVEVSVIQPKKNNIVSVSYDQSQALITVKAKYASDSGAAKIIVKSTDGGGAKASYKVWVAEEED